MAAEPDERTDLDEPALPTEGEARGDGTPEPAEGEEGERLSGRTAELIGERLRESVEREAAEAETAVAAHPLAALGAEPITPEALADTDYRVCPFCEGWGAATADEILGRLPDAVEALAPFPPSSVFVRCGQCDGWGRVLTGGRLAEAGIQPCPDCDGRGYLDTRVPPSPAGNGSEPSLTAAPLLPQGPDPMRLSPAQGGEPPAFGMVWFDDLQTWAYPSVPA